MQADGGKDRVVLTDWGVELRNSSSGQKTKKKVHEDYHDAGSRPANTKGRKLASTKPNIYGGSL